MVQVGRTWELSKKDAQNWIYLQKKQERKWNAQKVFSKFRPPFVKMPPQLAGPGKSYHEQDGMVYMGKWGAGCEQLFTGTKGALQPGGGSDGDVGGEGGTSAPRQLSHGISPAVGGSSADLGALQPSISCDRSSWWWTRTLTPHDSNSAQYLKLHTNVWKDFTPSEENQGENGFGLAPSWDIHFHF